MEGDRNTGVSVNNADYSSASDKNLMNIGPLRFAGAFAHAGLCHAFQVRSCVCMAVLSDCDACTETLPQKLQFCVF